MRVKLGEAFLLKAGKSIKAKDISEDATLYPCFGGNGLRGYTDTYTHDGEYNLIGRQGALCGNVQIASGKFYATEHAVVVKPIIECCDNKWLFYALTGMKLNQYSTGAAQPGLSVENLNKLELDIPDYQVQKRQAEALDSISRLIDARTKELQKLDELIKARFVEMFGDLKTNSKHWELTAFTECATIDTNMIHDFSGYENYPHIGIDSIERGTGRLSGYRTIGEDAVISGKYLFSPAHIIYSKIRPNLNKVALPDFDGLCSADAYPILVKAGVCTREYLAYTMRSSYFLDYILAFSNRTNLPKVNKAQVEGFMMPLPPMELQIQFSSFIKQVDKSKVAVQAALDEAQTLFDSLMQKYFG